MKQDPRQFRQAAKGAIARLRRRQWLNVGTIGLVLCGAAAAASGFLRDRPGPQELVIAAVLWALAAGYGIWRGRSAARVERALGEKIDGWWQSRGGGLVFIAAGGVFLEEDGRLYPFGGGGFRLLSAEYEPAPHAIRIRYATAGESGRDERADRLLPLPSSVRAEQALEWAQLIEERATGVRADARREREAPRGPVSTRGDDEDTVTDVADPRR